MACFYNQYQIDRIERNVDKLRYIVERLSESITRKIKNNQPSVLVIRCNACMKQEHLAELRRLIVAQAEEGVVVLPSYCELLTTAPEGVEILVDGQEG